MIALLGMGKGHRAHSLILTGNGPARLPLTSVGEGQTVVAFIELYQQSKNERLLLDYLTQNCCPVYWDTRLLSVKQTGEQVEAQLQNNDKQVTTIRRLVHGE